MDDSKMLFGENFLVKYVNLFALNFTNKGVLRIMKAKKLVSLALPVMLLSGCITIETDSKKAEPKKEETQKMEKESKSTDSKKMIAYLQRMVKMQTVTHQVVNQVLLLTIQNHLLPLVHPLQS